MTATPKASSTTGSNGSARSSRTGQRTPTRTTTNFSWIQLFSPKIFPWLFSRRFVAWFFHTVAYTSGIIFMITFMILSMSAIFLPKIADVQQVDTLSTHDHQPSVSAFDEGWESDPYALDSELETSSPENNTLYPSFFLSVIIMLWKVNRILFRVVIFSSLVAQVLAMLSVTGVAEFTKVYLNKIMTSIEFPYIMLFLSSLATEFQLPLVLFPPIIYGFFQSILFLGQPIKLVLQSPTTPLPRTYSSLVNFLKSYFGKILDQIAIAEVGLLVFSFVSIFGIMPATIVTSLYFYKNNPTPAKYLNILGISSINHLMHTGLSPYITNNPEILSRILFSRPNILIVVHFSISRYASSPHFQTQLHLLKGSIDSLFYSRYSPLFIRKGYQWVSTKVSNLAASASAATAAATQNTGAPRSS